MPTDSEFQPSPKKRRFTPLAAILRFSNYFLLLSERFSDSPHRWAFIGGPLLAISLAIPFFCFLILPLAAAFGYLFALAWLFGISVWLALAGIFLLLLAVSYAIYFVDDSFRFDKGLK